MANKWRAPLRDDVHRNLHDPELLTLEWATHDSVYCKRTYTLGKMENYGFAVLGLADDEVVEAAAISQLIVKHGDAFFNNCGGRKIFNTMPPWRSQVVMGRPKRVGNYSVDEGRHMVGQLSLSEPGHLPPELDAARIELNTHMDRLSELLRARLKAALGCGEIAGSIFSILRSIFARAQKLHCDLAYNGQKYKPSQLLGLIAFYDETEARLVPRTHSHATLSDVFQGCERGIKVILNKFDMLIMSPKLYHAGGESFVPLNYRLHFYWGFGPAVTSNKSKIFDSTHFLPDEAVIAALGARTVMASIAKKTKRERADELKNMKIANLKRGRQRFLS